MDAWHLNESPGEYRWGAVPDPSLGPRDVCVDIVASAVNHIDHWLTVGRPRPRSFPHVPGSDGTGVVSAVGESVTEWSIGDEVCICTAIVSDDAVVRLGIDSVLDRSLELFGEHRWGAHGERAVVPSAALVARPTTRSWFECAAYPTAYLTAYRMLRRARVVAGETVLVTGIGGGVATALLHLCRHMGASVVVTSRDGAKRAAALDMGADAAFDSGEPVPLDIDVVADSIGPAIWESAVRALVPGGRFVTCGGTSGNHLDVKISTLFYRQHEIIGSTLGSYEEFAAVTELLDNGLEVSIDEVVDIGDYPSAVERIRTSGQTGKIVIDHRTR